MICQCCSTAPGDLPLRNRSAMTRHWPLAPTSSINLRGASRSLDAVRNGSKSKKKPPTTSSDGHESRRWREGVSTRRYAEINLFNSCSSSGVHLAPPFSLGCSPGGAKPGKWGVTEPPAKTKACAPGADAPMVRARCCRWAAACLPFDFLCPVTICQCCSTADGDRPVPNLSATCAEHRGPSTRSERPRNRKRDHPRPSLSETTHANEVKTPQHDGTPRATRVHLPFPNSETASRNRFSSSCVHLAEVLRSVCWPSFWPTLNNAFGC